MSSKSAGQACGLIKEAVDAAAFDPDAWQCIVRLVAEHCPGSHPALVAIDQQAVRGAPMIWCGWDQNTLNAYEKHYRMVNPWTPFTARTPTLGTMITEKLLPISGLQQSEFYNDFMRPVGGIDAAIGLKIHNEADRVA